MSLLVFHRNIDTWKPGEHTGTFRGNQLAMVAGAKTLEIIQRDKLAAQARVKGDYFKQGLLKLAREMPCIAEVRGRGLMLGLEICEPTDQKNQFGEPKAAPELTLAIQRAALERGLIIEKGGRQGSVLRFLPPLIITLEQIDFALEALRSAMFSLVEPRKSVPHDTVLQQNWQSHFIQIGEGGAEQFEAAMQQTTLVLKQLFESFERPYSGLDPTLLASQIHHAARDEGPKCLHDVIDQVKELIGKNAIVVQHPHCIAHLHTPPMIPSLAAESFISALNQSMDSWDQSAAATFVEQELTDWLCEKFGYENQSEGVFTSGGTQSNLMALLLARDHALNKRQQWDVQQIGLPDLSQKLRIICSENAHFTMQKSAALLGLGEQSVVSISTYSDGTLNVELADQKIMALQSEGLIPFVITGTAGTTDRGAIDDLDDVAELARKHGLWMHVDAAYGGALILSRHHGRLEGIERADSITVDFHKMFFQPISCGALLIKDHQHFNYVRHHADYLNREEDLLPNLVDKSIATTRRFDALKVWMTLQNVGVKTLGAMVDHLLNQTQIVADLVNQNPKFELLAAPSLSTVLFRYRPSSKSIDLDLINKQLRLEALVKGQAVIGETKVDGKICLKMTLLNPCLRIADFEQLLIKLERVGDEILSGDTK